MLKLYCINKIQSRFGSHLTNQLHFFEKNSGVSSMLILSEPITSLNNKLDLSRT